MFSAAILRYLRLPFHDGNSKETSSCRKILFGFFVFSIIAILDNRFLVGKLSHWVFAHEAPIVRKDNSASDTGYYEATLSTPRQTIVLVHVRDGVMRLVIQ